MNNQLLPEAARDIIPKQICGMQKIEKSVRSLQFRFRAKNLSNQVKKHLGIAQNYKCTNYPFLIDGNEPKIPIYYNNKIRNTNFTLVSTSGLKAFEIINTMLSWAEIDLSAPNLVTPKLFVVDFSAEAKIFWTFVKKLFIEIQTFDDMCNMLYDINHKTFNFESSKSFKYAPEHLIHSCPTNTRQESYGLIVKRFAHMPNMRDRFNLIRNIIIMATFCSNNWFEKVFFANLAKHVNTKATYVYCSNILDCNLAVKKSSRTKEEHEVILKNFVSSVCGLKPILTLYSRTPLRLFESSNGLNPAALIVVGLNNIETHIALLRNPKLAPLTVGDYEEYQKANQTCNKRCNVA